MRRVKRVVGSGIVAGGVGVKLFLTAIRSVRPVWKSWLASPSGENEPKFSRTSCRSDSLIWLSKLASPWKRFVSAVVV